MQYLIETDENFSASVRDEFLENKELQSLLFDNPDFRDYLTKYRYDRLLRHSFEYLNANNSSDVTISHNTDPDRMFYSEMSRRPDLVSFPLRCLNSVKQNAHKMKIATIGCRTEAEIFSLINAGFNPKNIRGFDLFTNSPFIELGDVTGLSVASNTFDITVCGWVLEYVTEIEQAAAELKRITKAGGLIAIGGMHHPISLNLEEYSKRKEHQDRRWYCSVENIMKLFRVTHSDVVFKSDVEEGDLDKRGDVVVIFRVEK